MLVIKNLRWSNFPLDNYQEICNVLSNRLKLLKISFNAQVLTIDNISMIEFKDVEKGKTFRSSVDNVIKLKAGDDRIKKHGRDYLLSRRPTQNQYNSFFTIMHKLFDELNLNADIELYIDKTKEKFIIRKDKVNFLDLPKMRSFPTERI